MKYNPHTHHRRSIRFDRWDYRNEGAYFITICTYNRIPLFGEIADREMRLNRLGRAVEEEWLRSAEIRAEIELDAFVVMPNHIHGVVWIANVEAQGLAPLRPDIVRPFAVMPRSLGSMIRGFKSGAKIHINRLRGTLGASVWQRNYYERALRDERELAAARQYVLNNPLKWAEDKHNPLLAMQPGQAM